MVRWIPFPWGRDNLWFVAFTNNKNVGEPGGKAVAFGIFHMNHIKRTRRSLSVGDHTNSSQVSTSGHHIQVTSVKLDEMGNLVSLQINLNGVIHLGEGIRVAGGMIIMSYQMRDSFCAHKDLSHFVRLVLSFLRCTTTNSKVTLGVIERWKFSLVLLRLMKSIKPAG